MNKFIYKTLWMVICLALANCLIPSSLLASQNNITSVNLLSTTIPENSDFSTQFNIKNSDAFYAGGYTITFVSGTGGEDNNSFEVNENFGTYNLASKSGVSFNFESGKTEYKVKVKVTDDNGGSVTESFVLNVTNMNDAPTKINYDQSITSVVENDATIRDKVVLFVTGFEDEDASGLPPVYSIQNDPNNQFKVVVDPIFGDIMVQFTGVPFDYEAGTPVTFTLRISEQNDADLYHDETITLQITNDPSDDGGGSNEAPTNITLSKNSVNENSAVNKDIGNLSTTDPDAGDTHTYSLTSNPNDLLKISGNKLQVKNNINFEVHSPLNIEITTTDQGGEKFSKSFEIRINDINEAPTNISLDNNSVNEDENTGFVIGSFTTTDEDSPEAHVYAFVTGTGSDDNASFSITDDKLKLNTTLDFETKTSYKIRIKSTDKGGAGLSLEKSFTINVNNVVENTSPTNINLSTVSGEPKENSPFNTTVGNFSVIDADAGDTHTLALVSGSGSTHNNLFKIEGKALKINGNIDFENNETLSIRVKATDAAGASFEKTFSLNVVDQNEEPTNIVFSKSANQPMENANTGTTVGTFSVSDPDNDDSHTLTLVSGAGSDHNNLFIIDGKTLKVNGNIDFETNPTLRIRVKATDQNNLAFQKSFTLDVTNVAESPTDISLDQQGSDLKENSPQGTQVGVFTITDPDNGESHTITLVSGTGDDHNNLFLIDGKNLKVNGNIDFETTPVAKIRVSVTDGTSTPLEKQITITIEDVVENSDPTDITLDKQGVELKENSPSNTLVGIFSATDVDNGDTHTFTLVSGAGDTNNNLFSIQNKNELKVNGAIDFETTQTVSIRVKVVDNNGGAFEKAISISVEDVTENTGGQAPTDITLSNQTVAENSGVGKIIGNLGATDADTAIDDLSFFMGTGAGDQDNSKFYIDGKKLRANVSFNFENENRFQKILLKVVDPEGNSFDKIFDIEILNVQEAPTEITLDNNTVNETESSGFAIGNLDVVDDDRNEPYTFNLTADTDNGNNEYDNALFLVDGAQLKLNGNLDFDSKPTLKIHIQTQGNNDGLTFSQILTINVEKAVNTAPTNIDLSNQTIIENALADQLVGTISSTDADAGDTHTYVLIAGSGDTDNNLFKIDGNELKVKASNTIDFEQKDMLSIRLKTTDNGGASFEKVFSISVEDVDENTNTAPTNIDLSNQTIVENAVADQLVGEITTTDADAGNTHTYLLIAGSGDTDNNLFKIDGNELKVKASNTIDFEQKDLLSIRLKTTDNNGASFEKVFSITVEDVDENSNNAPTDIALSNNSILENQAIGTIVGSLTASDPDNGQTHTFSLVAGQGDTDNVSFKIVGDKLQSDEIFDFEAIKNQYSIRIEVNDGAGGSFSKVFKINITDIIQEQNTEPSDILLSNNSISENEPSGTTIGTLSTVDPDPLQTHIFSLVNGDGSDDNSSVTIEDNILKSAASFDFESKNSLNIRIKVADNQGGSFEKALIIDIIDEELTISLSNTTVKENESTDILVGELSIGNGNTATFELVAGEGDTNNNLFIIDGGKLMTAAGLDYEDQNSLSIRIKATDSNGEVSEQSFNIEVIDIPTITSESITLDEISLSNNSQTGDISATIMVDDNQGNLDITFVNGEGDDDNDLFIIEDNKIILDENLIDYIDENATTLSIRIAVTNEAGETVEKTFEMPISKEIEWAKVFSPNGDGINDEFSITYPNSSEPVKVMIMNKRSQIFFETDDYRNASWNGGSAPSGIYYISVTNGDDEKIGSFTLAR
ncbi:cadherin domain-containing protein [Aureibacter tunicatorum]|uniref:Flagellar hook-basal body complex protein FliE n=1 Tax=Aureibacter tunicatorum TaxID=866807 RepID=A0AAE4BSR1_9BACT|nr:cadherin domain-containing protein [Aureibacter tunicatorum]MDR6238692.1 flagellar hook-basal body complex protein FliE [Aureibacter tunicatorum]BDD05377.1 cellulosome anchoring protein [Aureibacter tunicatorum]